MSSDETKKDEGPKNEGPKITVATCVPGQRYTSSDKLAWLRAAIRDNPCDLFLTPQEFFGGHYVHLLAEKHGLEGDLHVTRAWIEKHVGDIAADTRTAIGVGACVTDGGGATEDYFYFNRNGLMVGYHRKFALPAYDDVRAAGAGRLWPEVSYTNRVTPVAIPELGLKIGTIFCWEVFNLTICPAYSMAGCNLIAHPIKFAPRGWLKLNKENGEQHIVGFGNAPKSEEWVDKLLMISRHITLCPIAISCNTWDLGPKMMALGGHVDEIKRTTDVLNLSSEHGTDLVHRFEMNPGYYSAMDSLYSMGAFKEVAGSIEGYHDLGAWTMHVKIRRLEAQLMGGTTRLDCLLKASTQGRQKTSTQKRAAKLLTPQPIAQQVSRAVKQKKAGQR